MSGGDATEPASSLDRPGLPIPAGPSGTRLVASIPPPRSDPEFRPDVSERSLPPVPDPGAYRRVLANPFLGLLGVAAWVAAVRLVLLGNVVLLGNAHRGGEAADVAAWVAAVRLAWFASVESNAGFVVLFAALLGSACFLPRLFQYHCLDCGRTGRLSRWKRHLCPAVARRIIEGRPRRMRGPGPMVQMLLWLYVLAVVLLLAGLAGLTSR